jgi:hypothetical protein
VWKAALEAAFTSSGMVLKQSLGAWTRAPTQVWRNFFNPSTQHVVMSTTDQETQFSEYKVIRKTRHGVNATPIEVAPLYAILEEVDWNVMIPTTVLKTRTRNIFAEFHSHTTTIQATDIPKTTFGEYVESLPIHIQRLLMQFEFVPGGERTLKHCLENNKILKIGTDGSVNLGKETASFGWLLIGNKNVLVRGSGPVDGVPDVLSSTRAELFGIGAPNEFLFHFMKYHNIESTSKCVKAVDNRAAISRVNRTQHKHSRRRRYSDDVDIVTLIVDRMKESTLRHRLRWVKAHQDDKRPYKDLDLWGRLNCDADKLAESFRQLMDDRVVKSLKEGFFTDSMEVGITVNGTRVTSHLLHQIRMHVQGSKHRAYLQDKHDWDNSTWNSIDWKGIKSGYLSLGPLKRIKTSKSMHGWLNTGRQKAKISPDATDSHNCPRCHEPNETQEHILKCRHVGAHKKRYDLVLPMMKKIQQNNLCPAQRVFTQCIRSWLESPETIIPDVSSVHDSQRGLLQRAIDDQAKIGWHLAMRGYLSKYWGLAVSANHHLAENNDKGEVWVRKTVLQLWAFAHEMWEHRNSVLHDTQLESSRKVRDAEINDLIAKLYEKVDIYSAEDRWYFDVPLAIRLRKPLRSRRRWLVNARILVDKSENRASIGQTTMNQYYPHLPSARTVVNASLRERIGSARQYIQTNLVNLWSSRATGSG